MECGAEQRRASTESVSDYEDDRRIVRGSWLAGGFQRAVKCVFAVTLVVYLASGSLRFMLCCVEWVRFVLAYLFHRPAGGRQSVFRITGRPTACTWTMSGLVGCADRIQVSFHVSGGTVRRSGERITGFWGFVSGSFHCVASCSPLQFWEF